MKYNNIYAVFMMVLFSACFGGEQKSSDKEIVGKQNASIQKADIEKKALEENFHMVLENVKIFINHFSAINTNNFVYIKTYIQKYSQQPLTIIDLYKKKTERDYEMILNEGNANKYIKWLIK